MMLWARRIWKKFQTSDTGVKVKDFYFIKHVKFFIHEVKGQESHWINYEARQRNQEERKNEHLCSIKVLGSAT